MKILASSNQTWGRKGFTLIEVILSLMILVLGIVSVQRVFIGSLSALNVIENWSQAERLLEEKIWDLENEVRKKKGKFNKRNASELILGSDRTFQYDVTLREVSSDAHLMEAKAVISWGKQGLGHSIKRTFYLMEPYANWKG